MHETLKFKLSTIATRWKILAWALVPPLLVLTAALALWKVPALRIPTIALVVAVFLILLLWLFPKWQVHSVAGLEAKDRFDRENESRKTLSQILGGLILLVGFYFTWQNLVLTREGQAVADRAAQENIRIASEGQITDRFTKAIGQLGDAKLEIRLGGIYALERIAKDSPKDQTTIMEVLTAYLRENASLRKAKEKPLKPGDLLISTAPDIQSILDVIGRRTRAGQGQIDQQLDLTQTDLRRANLGGAALDRVLLDGADLSEAFLNGATLRQADLHFANLSEAVLKEADLRGADLTNAVGLTAAQLESAEGNADTKLPEGIQRPLSWQ